MIIPLCIPLVNISSYCSDGRWEGALREGVGGDEDERREEEAGGGDGAAEDAAQAGGRTLRFGDGKQVLFVRLLFKTHYLACFPQARYFLKLISTMKHVYNIKIGT